MIISALRHLIPEQLLQVRQHETLNLRRPAILARIDRLLAIRTTTVESRSPRPHEGRVRDAGVPAAIAAPSLRAACAVQGSTVEVVDGAFGEGTFGRLSKATLADVLDCLNNDQVIEAAFSAGHHLALGHQPGWSRADHLRMIQARRTSIERDRREQKIRAAASGWAALRLLTEEQPGDVELYASVVRSDLQSRLAQGEIDIRAAGAAADLYLISGEWLPDDEESALLVRAIRFDIAARRPAGDDPLMEAARVAMWLVVSGGYRRRPAVDRSL
jgi:hypothetical protein